MVGWGEGCVLLASGCCVGSTRYIQFLDGFQDVRLNVEFETYHDEVVDYALVLTAEPEDIVETIRVYDGTHSVNEMHRYTRDLDKHPGNVFHRGTLGEGMRMAIKAINRGYEEMIDGWRRG
jgi:hypothetical protein